MIIVAGYLQVDATDRDRYVDESADLVERARHAPGCLDLAISADSVDPRRIDLYELWSSQSELDTFRATANPPESDIEIRNASMMEYVVDHSREPFTTD